MYYRSVNRGLMLTPTGRYTILLTLGLGFIAIASGYNGIYLSLSLGFATLISSGLVSEQLMKNYRMETLTDITADAASPFRWPIEASNHHPRHFLNAVENRVYDRAPRIGLITDDLAFVAAGEVALLTPASRQRFEIECKGLARGFYTEFTVVQRTLYPFGLVAKFKLSTVPCRVSILPAFNPELGETLRKELGRRLSSGDVERVFHSHRAYQTQDPIRHVDWKKSAGVPMNRWVLKRYEILGECQEIILEVSAIAASQLEHEETYERYLSHIRTACDVAKESGRPLWLKWETAEGTTWVQGHEDAVESLVRAPRFADRTKNTFIKSKAEAPPLGDYLNLAVNPNGHAWLDQKTEAAA